MVTQSSGFTDRLDLRPNADVGGGDWDTAISRRDEIVEIIKAELEDAHINALVQVSQPGVFPPWVQLERWLPMTENPSAQERASLEFVIDSFAFHRFPLVTTARMVRGNKSMEMCLRPHFSERHVRQWVRYAIGVGRVPENYKPVAETLGNIIRAVIPLPGPTHNPVERQFKGTISSVAVIVILSLLMVLSVLAGAWQNIYSGNQVPFFLVGVAGLLLAAFIASRRRQFVKPEPQSRALPMRLRLVDSWHEVIPALGPKFSSVNERVIKTLETLQANGISVSTERYGYDKPQGYEERERIVVSIRQCVLHVHLQPVGNDIFVAWQSNLNWGKWTETEPVSIKGFGRDRVEFRGVRPGVYIPTEIDLIDLNALSDLVHRRLTTALQALMRENAIDSDIDFEIIRGNREAALDAKKSGEGEATGWFGSRPAPGTMAWKPQAVTEREKSSGPVPSQRFASAAVSSSQGSLALAAVVVLAAVAIAYAINVMGLMFDPAYAISLPLTETYQYQYVLGIDFAVCTAIAASLYLLFGVSLQRALLSFVALYAAAFSCDIVFHKFVSGWFETSDEFFSWVGDDEQRNYVWIPYVAGYGVVTLTALSMLLPAMVDRRIWTVALMLLILSQTAMWIYGQATLQSNVLVAFLLPYFLFSGAIAYWMSRPESRAQA